MLRFQLLLAEIKDEHLNMVLLLELRFQNHFLKGRRKKKSQDMNMGNEDVTDFVNALCNTCPERFGHLNCVCQFGSFY